MPPIQNPTDFVPRGAMASFVVMIVGYVCLWFGMYCLMLHRG